jgi:hypothetical protein
MVDDLVPQYAELLRHLFLFHDLDTAQIAHLVARFRPVAFEKNKVVIRQGETGDKFFVIFSGRVKVTRKDGDDEKFLVVLGKGEYFGEEALLLDQESSATITTIEPTLMLYLDQELFADMLQDFPRSRKMLLVTSESRQLAYREDFEWLGEDEVVYIIKRRHELFLWTSVLISILVGLLFIPILAFGLSAYNSSFIYNLAAFIGVFGIIGSLIWTGWRWVDWGNDFYIVTNQRVLWLEKVVLLYNSRREAPLTQILAVNVTKTWFGRVLGYGNVDVRTFTGGIKMTRAADPDLFGFYVEGLKKRAGYFGKQAEQAAIRRALRERLGLPVDNGSMDSGLVSPSFRRRPRVQAKPGSWRYFLNTLFVVRYELEDVITYRKHWLLLIRKTWIPTFLLVMLVVWVSLQMNNVVTGQPDFFSSHLMFGIYFLSFIGLMGWWVYGYVDWSNDIYQLAPDQIRDIERKPLGDEAKKTAPLESILSLEHSRDGIIQLAFNYGNVIINVGETRFIFRGVYNPDQVHQDVSDYIEALSRYKDELEAVQEREQMLRWLLEYKDQAELKEIIESETDWDILRG